MATVNVPQQTGEIRIAEAGDPPKVYRVESGRINVEDPGEAARLALVVPDATVAGLTLAEAEALEAAPTADVLAGMSAADLVAYVEAHPEHAAAVIAAETDRPAGTRTTVIAAAERAAGS